MNVKRQCKEMITMSMKLNINGSTMEITDDNKTIVSSDIAKEINDNYMVSDNKKTCEKPDLVVKD
jgi:hypothetical protein